MSSDKSGLEELESPSNEPHAATERFPRSIGISRGVISHTEPITHAVCGNFLIQDHDRAPPESAPEHSNVPDGSLYQRCRVEWLTAPDARRETYEDSRGNEREAVVLDRDPEFSTVPDDDPSAVVLTSSKWTAGTGDGDDYSPWYSYHIARRPLDDEGEIQYAGSPKHTMTAVVEPQYDELVYPDGNDYSLAYGEGTHVKARVNYAENNGVVFTRIHDLVRVGLGYSIDYDDVLRSDGDYLDDADDDLDHAGKAATNESRDLTRIEQYVRVDSSHMDELRETISQSLDLIPTKGGRTRVIRGGSDDSGNWRRYGFISSDWDVLGYPDAGDLEIGLKVYVDAPDAPEPYCHPKIEAWVAGKNGEQLKWTPSDWDAINALLREIVVSHLSHAGVSEHDLESDDEFEPAERDEFRCKHPANRREWLRHYYADLKSSVEHEVRRTRTDLSRDILRALIYEARDLTLSELVERTGATKRAISRRVKAMEETGEPDEPGIVERVHSSECHVTMSSEMRTHVRDVLNATYPGENWSDVLERAEQRRQRRRERASTPFDDDRPDEEAGAVTAERSADDLDASDDVDEQPDDGRDAEPDLDDADVDEDSDAGDDSMPATWRYLADVEVDGDDLATALERDYLDERDVRVNIDASPALFTG